MSSMYSFRNSCIRISWSLKDNTHTDNDQTTYKNRTLIHNVWQSAQKANLLLRVTSPESQTTIYSQSRKPNSSPSKNWLQVTRTWSIPDLILPLLPIQDQEEKVKAPNWSHGTSHVLQFPYANSLQPGHVFILRLLELL